MASEGEVVAGEDLKQEESTEGAGPGPETQTETVDASKTPSATAVAENEVCASLSLACKLPLCTLRVCIQVSASPPTRTDRFSHIFRASH